jgi:CPA2 family monovalent cation:H+ antiporter-2
LVGLGVAAGAAIASIHQKRDDIRHTLQEAAQQAGLDRTRAIKAKTAIAKTAITRR